MPLSKVIRRRRILQGLTPSEPTSGEEVEVSPEEFEATYYQQERVLSPTHAPDGGMRLYDAVDGTWTQPLPRNYVIEHYIRKLVTKCSVCTFTSHADVGVNKHIEQEIVGARDHANGAEIRHEMAQGRVITFCTGCGVAFARPSRARGHISERQESAKIHADARPMTMFRFRLQPEPPVAPIAIGPSEPSTEGQDGRSRRKRSRRRRKRA